jgi:acyl carrier protein
MDHIKSEIRQFVLKQFPAARKQMPKDEDPLLKSGIIDSLGVLEVVSHLTEVYGIEIEEDDLMPENFESIDAISNLVAQKNGISG